MSNLTNNYRKYIAAAAAICLAMSAAGCSKSDSSSETDAKTASAQISSEAFEISAEDKDIGYDKTEAVKIALSGESAEIEGSGAACENGVLSITEGGTYILSGDLSGEIYVKAKDSEVKLVLNGVSVTNSDYAALMIDKASKVTLTLEDGTENSFADGAEYTLTDSNDNTDGCIFSRADLTINGSGSLSVTSSYKHGIVSKDNIVIESTAHCMAKVEDDFMARAPKDFADIERFLREMPYVTAKLHGAKYRFMYQVYASPKYWEQGKAFFSGVNIRYRKYAELLSGKLGMPTDFIQGMIYIFVRACVHYALFEDEDYLKLQLDAIRTSLRLFMKERKPKEEKP